MALTKTILCNLALSKIGNSRVQLTDFDSDTGSVKDQCDLHYEPTLHELVRMHTWNCTKERATLVETVPSITDSTDTDFTYNATENGKAQFSNSADDERIRWNSTLSRWEYDSTYSAPFSATYYNEGTGNVPPLTGWLKVSDDSDADWTLTHNYDFGWNYAFLVPSDCLRPLFLTDTTEESTYVKRSIEWTLEDGIIMTNTRPVYLLYIKEPAPADMDSLFAQAFYTLLAYKLAKPVAGDDDLARTILEEFYSVVMPEARRVNGLEGREGPLMDSEWLEATYTSSGSLGSSYPPFGSTTWTESFNWS
jgi:hypothetical protein